MKKNVAIDILEDIQQILNQKDGKIKAIKTIEIYIKNLEISNNKNIQKLIRKQIEYINIYGENSRKTIKLNKKIDKEIQKIFAR